MKSIYCNPHNLRCQTQLDKRRTSQDSQQPVKICNGYLSRSLEIEVTFEEERTYAH